MHVDINAGCKAHSLLRRSNKTQSTILDYFGSFEEANRVIAFVHEYINRDAVIRHRDGEGECVVGELCPALLVPQPLYFFANTPFQYFPMPFS
jgi:hypothetical protein